MRPRPEDRLVKAPPPRFRTGTLVLGIAVVVAVALVVFYSRKPEQPSPGPAPVPPPVATPAPAPPPAPDIPEPVLPTPAAEQPIKAPVAPQLTLESSDEELRAALRQAGVADVLAAPLDNADLVQRAASVIDGLSQGAVLRKVLPLPPLKGEFSVVQTGEQITVDPASYARYDHYAALVSRLNPDALAATFHRFRPLLEQAYAALGHPPQDFDNAVIAALDRILATPEFQQPPALKKVEATYKYVDPQLEALPDIQKQLLRAGPENTARIKHQARVLRRVLLKGRDEPS